MITTITGVCIHCGVRIVKDEGYGWPASWYDPDVVDVDNPGVACHDEDGNVHEVAS